MSQSSRVRAGESEIRTLLLRRSLELDKSFKTLAIEAGIARSYLYKLADGIVKDPSIKTLTGLAKAMEISPVSLLRLFGDLNFPRYSRHNHAGTATHGIGIGKGDLAVMNSDITIPSHTVVGGGEVFEKVWEIQNVGTRPWTGRRLTRVDDWQLTSRLDLKSSISHPYLASLNNTIAISDTFPGNTVQIATHFCAPKKNCSVASVWRIEDSDGRPCYATSFFLQVVVTVLDK